MVKWSDAPTTICYHPPHLLTGSFQLSKLACQNLLAAPAALEKFQQHTGLADFYWKATYYRPPNASRTLREALETAEGFIILLHGCNGSHRTWQDLPLRLVDRNRHLVCLNPDIYGFGRSPFLAKYPPLKYTTMPAAMAAVEYWLELIGLWPATQRRRKPFYLFVGHSMGGGMLFYKDETRWRNDLYGCYLISPSMFYRDRVRQLLYQLAGLATLIPYITPIKILATQAIIHCVMNGASRPVKWEHARLDTPFSTLAASLCGIGHSPKSPRTDWSQFKIVMGNRDIVVSPRKMLNFAEELGLKPHQVRVTLGDHYFFSCDETSPQSHWQGRRLVIDDLTRFGYDLSRHLETGIKQ